jgi:hypothetical protein
MVGNNEGTMPYNLKKLIFRLCLPLPADAIPNPLDGCALLAGTMRLLCNLNPVSAVFLCPVQSSIRCF